MGYPARIYTLDIGYRYNSQSDIQKYAAIATPAAMASSITANMKLVSLLAAQVLLTAALCLATAWAQGGGGGDLPLATWLFQTWNFGPLMPILLSLLFLFWLGMHLGLKYFRAWPTRLSYIGFSLVLGGIWAYAAANITCDPLIRVVKANKSEIWPLSQASAAGPGWQAEKSPRDGTRCVSYTPYTHQNQNIVTIAAVVSIVAFIVPIALAWTTSSSSPHAAVFSCGVVVAVLGGSVQIVLNEPEWNWTIVHALLAVFAASAYLSACVVSLHFSEGDDTFERAAWVYTQLAMAIEDLALKLAENSSKIGTSRQVVGVIP